ncbi:hypothetical protein THASP1DRAFT_29155 [Thamnocephalis sphaerospora]|uniref:DH domain-containing protein n=1 Tax=Thamnocephalis sphaerospora TaxID=78915 RepID=A0A4P9XSF8_9FUNG|nr:hypothetical protein THASP1DRAFT_29155 [Thamnocephalis sphaerospora]|eukprot:RKP09048.1 hypothetical protein THASP1DRAFT_29155 [Thamnocephalis sphaerospora]
MAAYTITNLRDGGRTLRRCVTSEGPVNSAREVSPPSATPTPASSPRASLELAYDIAADDEQTLFATQLQKLINRETAYIEALTRLRDAFWMPLARRYLGGRGNANNEGRPYNPRRRFSLMGLLHMPRNLANEHIVQTLNGLFGYLPALTTLHMCLNEELKVFHALDSTVLEVASVIRVRIREEFDVYVSHVENYANALADFENLCLTDTKFRVAIEDCSANAGGLSLRTLLRRPIDHIWKYISFLETVLTRCTDSNTSQNSLSWHQRGEAGGQDDLSEQDSAAVTRCIETVQALTTRMHPWVERINSIEELATLQTMMIGQFEPFLSAHQTLVHRSDVCLTANGYADEKPMRAWLLSDRLLLVSPKQTASGTFYAHRETILLKSCAILASLQATGPAANVIRIYTGDRGLFSLRINNYHGFQRWCAVLSDAVCAMMTNTSGAAPNVTFQQVGEFPKTPTFTPTSPAAENVAGTMHSRSNSASSMRSRPNSDTFIHRTLSQESVK